MGAMQQYPLPRCISPERDSLRRATRQTSQHNAQPVHDLLMDRQSQSLRPRDIGYLP